MLLCRYQIMRSCWDADPFNRPPFRKVVERIEQQLSDATKHVGCFTLIVYFHHARFKITFLKKRMSLEGFKGQHYKVVK